MEARAIAGKGPDDAEVARYIRDAFENVEAMDSYGYTMFFYGSERMLPFVTLIAADNEDDKVSDLDRQGAFRINIGVSKDTYHSLLGPTPPPPGPSGVIETGADYTALDTFIPHPHYGNMNWLCVLSPSAATWEKTRALIEDAYGLAKRRAERRGDAGTGGDVRS